MRGRGLGVSASTKVGGSVSTSDGAEGSAQATVSGGSTSYLNKVIADAKARAETTADEPESGPESPEPPPEPPPTVAKKKRCGWACAFAAVAGFIGGSILGKRWAGK